MAMQVKEVQKIRLDLERLLDEISTSPDRQAPRKPPDDDLPPRRDAPPAESDRADIDEYSSPRPASPGDSGVVVENRSPVPVPRASSLEKVPERKSSPRPKSNVFPKPKADLSPGRLSHLLGENLLRFLLTFAILYFVFQLQELAAMSSINVYRKISFTLPHFPFWVNSIGSIVLMIFATRLLFRKFFLYGLGMLVGIPVSINIVISNYVDDFVAVGIAFSLAPSLLVTALILLKSQARPTLRDIACVTLTAMLTICAMVGVATHLLLGLIMATLVGLILFPTLLLFY